MAQRNDQVFQLSLTEIAFTISFLLLLLLGYLVFKEETARIAAEEGLAAIQTAESATSALNTAKSELTYVLTKANIGKPDDVISKLVDAEQIRAERDQFKQQVQDIDAKLTALTELSKQIQDVGAAKRKDITRDEVLSALALQEQVRAVSERVEPAKSTKTGNKQVMETVHQALTITTELKQQLKDKLRRDLLPGTEAQTIKEIVTAAQQFGALSDSKQNPETVRKENSDLRGQVAFLKNRLEARGGRDYPPCWADETGKVEFLFAIEVRPDSVSVAPAWPARRESSAEAMPGIDAAIAGPHTNQAFVSKILGIFNWSKTQDPECRHYVQLRSSISDAVQSDRARLMVENYFYKVEARR
jgi:hypothetical protein